MPKAFFSALNVRKDEERPVLLLLGKGFFLGIFLAAYEVSAETLFLNRMIDYLKEAIVVSGILGVITTALFASLQGRVKFSRLATGNLLLILLFTFGIYFFYNQSNVQIQDYLIFLMYAMTGPITAVILLGFWGTFGRLFDLRQSKRIIGRIDVGQLIAAIGTLFAIPLLQSVIPETSSYLLISAISIGIALLFLIALNWNQRKDAPTENFREQRKATQYGKLVRNDYVRMLSMFLIFSMVTFTFIQYSFQNVVAEQFPEESAIRNFISIFRGVVLILGFLMQSFVNDRIISEYGLKVSLMILPVIVGLFAVAAIIAWWVMNFNLTAEMAFFFLFISLSRLFNWSIRDSLENPTFKLYFMPFNIDVRFNIQTKVEGVVNEGSRLIAGLLILGLSTLPFIEQIDYLYAVLFLIVGYFVVIKRLYQGYREMIAKKLASQQQELSPEKSMTMTEQLVIKLNNFLKDQMESMSIFAFRLLAKIHPQVLPHSLNVLMSHEVPGVRSFAQNQMNELKGISVSDQYVIQNGEAAKDKKVISKNDLLDLFKYGEISRNRVYKLSKSSEPEDRQYAAEIISNYSDEDKSHYLVELLYDPVYKVRHTAMKTAQKKYNWEVLNALIDNLNQPSHSIMAANALTAIGKDALPALDNAFYKYVNEYALTLKIVQIIGRIGGDEAIELLWNKIDFPHKLVVSEVMVALGNCGFKASVTQIPRIKYAIESDIEAIAWNMAAYNEVPDTHFGMEIRDAIEEEVEHDISHIYMLLSMLYDASNISLVKENIESGTSEGLTYAIELLDVFLSDDLKKRIIPVLDDLTFQEKARQLEVFYPRKQLDDKAVLRFLLNRDSTQSNRWTKACVLYQIGSRKIEMFKRDVIANLFNPDVLIHEVAAWSLHQIDPDGFEKNISRLDKETSKRLKHLVLESGEEMLRFRFQQVRFLKSTDMFRDIPGVMVADISDIISIKELVAEDILSSMQDFDQNFFIIRRGEVSIWREEELVKSLTEGTFLGESLPIQYSRKEFRIAENGTILYVINKEIFYEWLSDNVGSAKLMTSQMNL